MSVLPATPEFEHYHDEAMQSLFYAKPLCKMNKDDLLTVIGFLIEQQRWNAHVIAQLNDNWSEPIITSMS